MSGNKKVLFLTHWAKNMGGAEYSLTDLLPETARHAEVHLCTTESGRLTEHFTNLPIQTHIIPCTTLLGLIKRYTPLKSALFLGLSLPYYFYYVSKIHRLVKQIRPDCIHANVPKSHVTLALLLLSGFRGTAIIHIREIFPRFSAVYLLYSLLFLFSHVRIIAISHAVKEALPSHLQSRSSVIHNGITIADRPLPFPPMSPVRFLYFGRIVPWKGCHYLIEAFHSLLQCVPPESVNLTLSGPTFYWDAAYRNTLTGLIRNYQLDHLIHMDHGSDTPYTVYEQHHVLCLMSDNEPLEELLQKLWPAADRL